MHSPDVRHRCRGGQLAEFLARCDRIAVELALVLLGSYSYLRAAVAVARSSDRGIADVYTASGLLLSTGLVTLTLDVLGY